MFSVSVWLGSTHLLVHDDHELCSWQHVPQTLLLFDQAIPQSTNKSSGAAGLASAIVNLFSLSLQYATSWLSGLFWSSTIDKYSSQSLVSSSSCSP
jgi:hypothetical protein